MPCNRTGAITCDHAKTNNWTICLPNGVIDVPAGVEIIDALNANFIRYNARMPEAVFRVTGESLRPVVFRNFYFVGGIFVDHVSDRMVALEDVFVKCPQGRGCMFQPNFYFSRRYGVEVQADAPAASRNRVRIETRWQGVEEKVSRQIRARDPPSLRKCRTMGNGNMIYCGHGTFTLEYLPASAGTSAPPHVAQRDRLVLHHGGSVLRRSRHRPFVARVGRYAKKVFTQ